MEFLIFVLIWAVLSRNKHLEKANQIAQATFDASPAGVALAKAEQMERDRAQSLKIANEEARLARQAAEVEAELVAQRSARTKKEVVLVKAWWGSYYEEKE